MTTSEYNDNRPQDGQDAQEEERALLTAYDMETLVRFETLADRFRTYQFLSLPDMALMRSLLHTMETHYGPLLKEEGH